MKQMKRKRPDPCLTGELLIEPAAKSDLAISANISLIVFAK